MADGSEVGENMMDGAVVWTRRALVNLFDLDFLSTHIADTAARGRFTSALQAQQSLLDAIESIRPPASVSVRAPAWRQYHVLNLSYVQGLSQAEVSAQLNLGVRQLRRELAKAVRAVAALLFAGEPFNSELKTTPAESPASTAALHAHEHGHNDAGEHGHERDYLHAEELLRTSLALLDPLLQRQDVSINVMMASHLPAFRGDAMVARQLIISAVTWMLHDVTAQTLLIELKLEHGYLVLRFHRPDSNDDAGQLSIVQRLASLAEAQTTLDSTGEAVTLTLRLAASDRRAVLIIDDNPDAIQLVQRMLQDSDEFYLVSATRPEEALRLAATVQPACILLDVMMPQRDGWELLTLFKTYPETSNIPIVISSVLQQEELAFALGAVAVLPKPFTAEQLLAEVRRATGLARSPAQ